MFIRGAILRTRAPGAEMPVRRGLQAAGGRRPWEANGAGTGNADVERSPVVSAIADCAPPHEATEGQGEARDPPAFDTGATGGRPRAARARHARLRARLERVKGIEPSS